MNRTKFKTQEISKTNPLVRLAILEASISELNQKIQIAQGQQKFWKNRQDAYEKKISKKYKYHELLQKEVEEQLFINDVVVNKVELICAIGKENCPYTHKDVLTCKYMRKCSNCGN